ncbi:MAG: DNA recombination protein RmuC [Gammaproteobacteria bacterium]|nr:DNA recombination protein RmuC [Gammaproteobacteria bacterium]
MELLLPIAMLLAGLVAGFAIAALMKQKTIAAQEKTNIELQAKLSNVEAVHAERLATVKQSHEQLSQQFQNLASQALARNNEQFLKLAEQNLKSFQVQSQGDLEKKEQAIENLVRPIREALEKTQQHIHQAEKERKESYGALNQHLQNLNLSQQALQGETRNLVNALRRPEVRGQWGEMTLKRLAELAGMVEYCDFFEQTTINTEDGRLRPDMIVRLPGGRDIVVDIKTPLDAYLSAMEASDDNQRQIELQRHARHVRDRVKELSSKAYWNQFKNSPDFVVLFIPGEQFLGAALDVDRNLLEDAMKNKVILSTPTSFVALMRAVAYGWRQEALAENAEQIRALGEELYSRLATFGEHLNKVGKSLEQSVGHYNKAVSSFDSRVLPGARKFTELGIAEKKVMADSAQVETLPRQVSSLELDTSLEQDK